MSDSEQATVASEAEINAALAEAERQGSRIPSLDDGSDERVVHVPVEVDAPVTSRQVAAGSAEPGVVAVAQSVDGPAAAAPTPGRRSRHKSRSAAQWLRLVGLVIYDVIDRTLWAVNLPFEWMKPEARQLTGWLAIVTIATSLLAMNLLPTLLPADDALSVLKRQTEQTRAEISEPPAPDAQAP